MKNSSYQITTFHWLLHNVASYIIIVEDLTEVITARQIISNQRPELKKTHTHTGYNEWERLARDSRYLRGKRALNNVKVRQ